MKSIRKNGNFMRGTVISLMVLLLFRLGIRRRKQICWKNGRNRRGGVSCLRSVARSRSRT